jgi:hypothetical protein
MITAICIGLRVLPKDVTAVAHAVRRHAVNVVIRVPGSTCVVFAIRDRGARICEEGCESGNEIERLGHLIDSLKLWLSCQVATCARNAGVVNDLLV